MSNNIERKRTYGDLYGLNNYDLTGDCIECKEKEVKINKIRRCNGCQLKFDLAAGVVPKEITLAPIGRT